jgi:hypothetical protein
MRKRRIALLVDIDNVKIGKEAFNELYEKLTVMGDVAYCKFYGYNDRKHLYLTDIIAKYGYETASFMRFKKRFSQLDNRILVDAVRINYTKPEIDTFCIVAGDGDLIPLLVELKSCGKFLIDINTPYQEQNIHMFDEHIRVYGMDGTAETYQPKAKKGASTAPRAKKPAAAKPVATVAPVAPVASMFEEDEEEYVEEYVAPVARAPQKPQSLRSAQPAAPVAPAPAVVYEEEYDDYEEEEDSYSFMDSDLQDKLNDITARTSELDFSDSRDMSKKLKLISDIESIIEEETNKGEGLNSENPDIKQIFVELQELVEDMRSAL